MIKKFIKKVLDINQKEINRLSKMVEKINGLEKEANKLKDSDFAKKTSEFKKRIKKGESLESLLPEAFAVAREASYRTIGLKPYDVQLMASIALFEGKVVEQKTGEGKTLSAVPALYLRALSGKGVHLVTVNDYLARRDAGWNGPIFEMLDLSVSAIIQNTKSFVYDIKYSDKSHGDERLERLKPSSRKEAYERDVTYGTNNEFGFDYLRDNMVQSLDNKVQRGHHFAIVDEVDSVLVDEARTPLIISAPDMQATDKYFQFANLIKKLKKDDYSVDEKAKSANLTEKGVETVEKLLGVSNLYEKDFDTVHHIENALRAKTLYLRDREYLVKEGKVTIVDEFTGRLMVGRRWSDGLHQAVEAKEKVEIQQESKTMATISFQNYFRMYENLAGMTGTAATEAEEFKKIYNLDTVVIPTNMPLARKDSGDVVYKTLNAKYNAIASEAMEKHKKGQPVLVGTTSIEKNEIIHDYLKRKKVPHNMLNAKNHEKEASVIAEAGKVGAVTVATNMAGRGVDIVLGGSQPEMPPGVEIDKHKKGKAFKKWEENHEKVISAGGLHVIGTERHESRRIDNQLRGRSGRQGDAGSTRFFLSLEDDLMRIFGGEQISGLMDKLKLPENQPIENALVGKAIEQAQVKVEGFNFDIRKNLVEYDDVANQQREIVYKLRERILESKDLKSEIKEKLKHQIDKKVLLSSHVDSGKLNTEKLLISLLDIIPFDDKSKSRVKTEIEKLTNEGNATDLLVKVVGDVYESREKQVSDKVMRQIEKFAYLGSLDHHWIEHIDYIDGLREGVRLRGYAQRDPLVEFKNEAYEAFEGLLDRIDSEHARRIFRVGISTQRPEIPLSQIQTNVDKSDAIGLATGTNEKKAKQPASNRGSSSNKLGRNDPCWCKSGKKFKKCHYPQQG